MFAAIQASKAAAAAYEVPGRNQSGEENDRLGDAGFSAWERMLKTTPTSLAGVLAFMAYARERGTQDAFLNLSPEEGPLEAWEAVERMLRDLM
jgi:hypothetical protein